MFWFRVEFVGNGLVAFVFADSGLNAKAIAKEMLGSLARGRSVSRKIKGGKSK